MDERQSRHDELQDNARRHLLQHFARNGAYGADGGELLVLDRGEGCHVFDTRGRRYIDALSSLFCCQIGYSHGEEMAAASAQQINRLAFNTNWSTAHPPAIDLATELAARAPDGIEHVFFTCGGSESVETAWKLVRHFHLANGEPQRTRRSRATSPTTASRSGRSRSRASSASASRSGRPPSRPPTCRTRCRSATRGSRARPRPSGSCARWSRRSSPRAPRRSR